MSLSENESSIRCVCVGMGVVCFFLMRMRVVCVSISTCQWVGGGHVPFVIELRLTMNGSSL